MARLIAFDRNPDARKLRGFGLAALVVLGALASAAWYALPPLAWLGAAARGPVAGALLALAAQSGVLGWLHPRGNRPLYLALSLLAYPIGVVVSYALLALLFFGLFTPLGLLLRALGRDPLQRKRDLGRESYWTRPRPPRDKASYFRTY